MTTTSVIDVVPEDSPRTGGGNRRRRSRLLSAPEPKHRFGDLDHRTKTVVLSTVVTGFAIILVMMFLLPFWFMVTGSLKTPEQFGNGQLLPKSPKTAVIDGEAYDLLNVPIDGTMRKLALVEPKRNRSTFIDPADPDTPIAWEGNWRGLEPDYELDPSTAAFGRAWRSTSPPMSRLMTNTAVIAGIGMIGAVSSSVLVAYGLSRFRIPFKKVILGSLLATIIMPRFVTVVPTYMMWKWAGGLGTYLPLIVPTFFASAYNVFLLRQFFMTIPRQLDEAAAIDGAGPLRTLLFVILPQSKGAILAVALFHFFFAWNDFFEPLIFLISKPEKMPLSVGLFQFMGLYDNDIPLILTGALITMAVPIAVFAVLQKVFLGGIKLDGSIK